MRNAAEGPLFRLGSPRRPHMAPVVLLTTLWVTAAAAAEFTGPQGFQRHTDASEVTLGEPFTYEIVITHPKEHRYELLRGGDLGAFELLSEKRRRHDGASSATTTFELKMSVFELGKHRVPELAFEVATPEGVRQWSAPGVELECKPTLDKDAEKQGANLYDIRPPEEVPVPSYRLLYLLAAIAGAALVAFAAYKLFRRLRRPGAVPVAPTLPLHVRAQNALDALRTENLPAQSRFQEFYFRLSEILRGYLGERYGIEALESTTHELLSKLRTLHTPGLPMDEWSRLCEQADLAKYARAPVTPDECHAALQLGYRLIHLTTAPALPPAPPDDAQRPRAP